MARAKTLRDLQKTYDQAVKDQHDGFVIEGFQFHTPYAKYLLEYLIKIRKVPLNTPLRSIIKEA